MQSLLTDVSICTADSFGIVVLPESDLTVGAAELAMVNKYFSAFADPQLKVAPVGMPKCVCGKPFLNLLGTFTWGITSGEGYCAACEHPARMNHRICNEAGEECYTMRFPLAYHPSVLTVEPISP